MDLSVVVPTLDGRAHLGDTLDALAAHAPAAEVVVVNGPSTDGTGGLVREHPAPDRLVEVAERNPTVARNAGIAASTGDAVAFVGQGSAVEEGWAAGVSDALSDGAAAVTGPVHRAVGGGLTTDTPERTTTAGREVTYFDDGNVAVTREALDALDGFDEYLVLDGGRDLAHRLAATDRVVGWAGDVAVLRSDAATGGDRLADADGDDWGLRYRCRTYWQVKNYGLRPAPALRTLRRMVGDGARSLGDVLAGDGRLSTWFGSGRDVVTNAARGTVAGLTARAQDRSPARNPHGVSARDDRVVPTQ